MYRKITIIGICILTGLASIIIVTKLMNRPSDFSITSQLYSQASLASNEGFTRAAGPIPINFPADNGPHPDYQTEWWYYTGNLETPDRNHFGYQLTFFRRALLPPGQVVKRASDFGTDQVYMAHLALTDVTGKRYDSYERLERGAGGLAGVQANPFKAWLDNWRVDLISPGIYKLHAAQDDLVVDLKITDQKGPVLQGNQGYSQKGADPGNASYYVSYPRLETEGTIQVGEKLEKVSGLSWMDHEWSTSALATNEVGWDWFSIQLDDNSEIMVYQIRKADGSIDPFSSGTLIAPDGSARQLTKDEFNIEVVDTWTSPHTNAKYPAHWRLKIPSAGLSIEIRPYLPDQELQSSYKYWEGAVRVLGDRSGSPVSGNGYVELTGYAGSFAGQF